MKRVLRFVGDRTQQMARGRVGEASEEQHAYSSSSSVTGSGLARGKRNKAVRVNVSTCVRPPLKPSSRLIFLIDYVDIKGPFELCDNACVITEKLRHAGQRQIHAPNRLLE